MGNRSRHRFSHRGGASTLTDLGAVVAFTSNGTSEKGFAAEWRALNILTIEGDLISRGEIFDEDDLEAALARFDELAERKPKLENAASQVNQRFWDIFAARDWAAIAASPPRNMPTIVRRVVTRGSAWPRFISSCDDRRNWGTKTARLATEATMPSIRIGLRPATARRNHATFKHIELDVTTERLGG